MGELEAVGAVWADRGKNQQWSTRLATRWHARRPALQGHGEAARVLGQLDWFDSVQRRWCLSAPQVWSLPF